MFLSIRALRNLSKKILRHLLLWHGAEVKNGLTSTWKDGQIGSLLDLVEDNTPPEKEAAEKAVLDLTLALGISSPTILKYLQRLSGTVSETTGGHSTIIWDTTSRERSSADHYMTPVLFRSMGGIAGPPESAVASTSSADSPVPHAPRVLPISEKLAVLSSWKEPRTGKRTVCGLRSLTFVVISSIIAALCIAIGVLGAFLGVEVRQNNELEARVAQLTDNESITSSTVTVYYTATYLATAMLCITASTSTTSSTPASSTTQVAKSQGLSSGAIAGIVVGALAVAMTVLVTGVYLLRRRRSSVQTIPPATPSPLGAISPPAPPFPPWAANAALTPPATLNLGWNCNRQCW